MPKHISALPSLQHSPGLIVGVAETSLTQQCAGPLIMFAKPSGLGLPSLTLQPHMPMKCRVQVVESKLLRWQYARCGGSFWFLLVGGARTCYDSCYSFCMAGLSDACVRLWQCERSYSHHQRLILRTSCKYMYVYVHMHIDITIYIMCEETCVYYIYIYTEQ